jgi:thiosulfate dehydrogenase
MYRSARLYNRIIWIIIAGILVAILMARRKKPPSENPGFTWKPQDSTAIPQGEAGELIRYGKKLVANTAWYLGPKGRIAAISNGMNCQNCHLEAGTRLNGNNYSAVFSCYPKFRERSGTVENIYKRINDCLERSLNGKSLDSTSREMKAMSAYINWVGQAVPKDVKPVGAGISDIQFLDKAADSNKGHLVYLQKCQSCHGPNGAGLEKPDGSGYAYPPLWGSNSYNTAAGLYRVSRFAGYVKYNMPYGNSEASKGLTTEEAWDLAAFVNSQPRPEKKFAGDWPKMASKPVDYPFGPYSDGFTENQHKFGPFGPIQRARKRK